MFHVLSSAWRENCICVAIEYKIEKCNLSFVILSPYRVSWGNCLRVPRPLAPYLFRNGRNKIILNASSLINAYKSQHNSIKKKCILRPTQSRENRVLVTKILLKCVLQSIQINIFSVRPDVMWIFFYYAVKKWMTDY